MRKYFSIGILVVLAALPVLAAEPAPTLEQIQKAKQDALNRYLNADYLLSLDKQRRDAVEELQRLDAMEKDLQAKGKAAEETKTKEK